VNHVGIIESLLHPVRNGVVVIFGFNDGDGYPRLIKQNIISRFMVVLIALYAIIQFVVTAAAVKADFMPDILSVNFLNRKIIIFSQNEILNSDYNVRPVSETHDAERVKAVLEKIREDNKEYGIPGAPVKIVLVTAFLQPFTDSPLNYYNMTNNKENLLFEDVYYFYRNEDKDRIMQLLEDRECKYLIYNSSAREWELDPWSKKIIDMTYQLLKKHPKGYIPIFKDYLPNGNQIIVFRHLYVQE